MKLDKDVNLETIESVLNLILDDLQDYIDEAKKAYENDKTDDFHENMALMFGLAKEMIEGRLSILEDEKEEE